MINQVLEKNIGKCCLLCICVKRDHVLVHLSVHFPTLPQPKFVKFLIPQILFPTQDLPPEPNLLICSIMIFQGSDGSGELRRG